MVARLIAKLPDVHADARRAAADRLDTVVPAVADEVVAQPHLGAKEVVAHLRAAL